MNVYGVYCIYIDFHRQTPISRDISQKAAITHQQPSKETRPSHSTTRINNSRFERNLGRHSAGTSTSAHAEQTPPAPQRAAATMTSSTPVPFARALNMA